MIPGIGAFLMVGKSFAHYVILEKAGAGGMGVVFRAHDEKLHRDVALKLPAMDSLTNEQARSRILREARAASALNHPNICTIYEVGEVDGQPYIAMEYVPGETLSKRIPTEGLPTESVLDLGAQIADAMDHAHSNGILHRENGSDADTSEPPFCRHKLSVRHFAGREVAGDDQLPAHFRRDLVAGTARKKIIRLRANHALKRNFAQPQCVGNDRDGAEAHRGAGEHGAEQPAEDRIENTSRHGNSDRVIEECKEKVLLDVADSRPAQLAGANDAAQVAFHQRDAGVFDGHVGAGAHGDPHIGRG